TQGHLQLALGKAEQALENWQKASAIYSEIKDTEGIIGSQLNQAQALQYLGLYRRAKKTLEQLESSLNSQANSPIKVTGLRSLGNALRVIGDLEKSRTLLQQSLSIAQELRSKEAISAVYFSLGNVARDLAKNAIELEDTSTAKTETETALNAYQEAIKTSVSPK
ncbi:hypothetical protein NLK90_27355, partial [Klebsiella pneumoniae]|uniref:hypothetical protein n=1 Tax=Klebsiella pneumoniae TaxID=573 RepID=UPI0021D2B66B